MQDADSWESIGGFQVKGGILGDESSGDCWFENNVLHVRTSTPITVRTPPSVDGEGNVVLDADGRVVPTTTNNSIQIDAGVRANLTLAGVDIKTTSIPLNVTTNKWATESGEAATIGSQIPLEKQTSLYLTLADGSVNKLATTTGSFAALRCGDGSILFIDDAVRNVDVNGEPIPIYGAKIDADVTLGDGTFLAKGTSVHALDSANPGSLTCTSWSNGAGIGGCASEAGGTMTFNGGDISVPNGWGSGCSGIGGGGWGSGTLTLITFNSGRYDIRGGAHGAGIGAGAYVGGGYNGDPADLIVDTKKSSEHGDFVVAGTPNGGNILVNGGYIISIGGGHGAGFGGACTGSGRASILNSIIRITGGTLLPKGAGNIASEASPEILPDIGGYDGHVIIEGGSIYCSDRYGFLGIGDTAWGNDECLAEGYDPSDPNDPNKVFMVTVDLSADGVDTEPIDNWQLTVGGVPYDYGAPTYFDKGKLYLWLPKEAADKVIDADFSYTRTLEDGTQETVTPTTMYRDPHSPADPDDPNRTKLKRYVEFELDPDYEASLEKYYDGLPFDPYTWSGESPIVAPQDPDHPLTDPTHVDYTYRIFDRKDGKALTGDIFNGNEMPKVAGAMQFALVSREYALADGFRESFWGHRAFGWCTIKPIASVVRDVTAEWADEPEGSDTRPGSVEHGPDARITVSAIVDRAATVDGKEGSEPTKGTCEAPEGRIQLYVDGQPVGEPLPLELADEGVAALSDDDPAAADEPAAPAEPVVTAERQDNGEGGGFTKVTYTFSPAAMENMPGDLDGDNIRKLSLRFLRPTEEQVERGVSANYLESASPADADETDQADVALTPLEPNASLEKEPDSPGTVVIDPESTPDNPSVPGFDPEKPHNKTYDGSITLPWCDHEPGEPSPGRMILKLDSDSPAPVTVTAKDGTIITADLVRDAEGNPVRDEDGKLTVWIDPETPGFTELTVKQEPGSNYAGTTFRFDVTVTPDPSRSPKPTLSKTAENADAPEGPTKQGHRIDYAIAAANGEKGTLWMGATVSDPLPACMDLAADSVRLVLANGTELALEQAPAGSVPALGQYALSAPGADGRRVLSAPAGDVGGGLSVQLRFQCTVRSDLDFSDPEADALWLGNVASATGTRPGADDPTKPMDDPNNPGSPLPVTSEDTAPALPAGPEYVAAPDPGTQEPAGPGEPTNPEQPAEPDDPAAPSDPADPTGPGTPPADDGQSTPDSPAANTATGTLAKLVRTGDAGTAAALSLAAAGLLAACTALASRRRNRSTRR